MKGRGIRRWDNIFNKYMNMKETAGPTTIELNPVFV
jgi:hypothetical protein